MNINFYLAVLLLVFTSLLVSQEPDIKKIIKEAEERYKGETSQGTFTMNVVTTEFSRTVKMKSWNKGNDKALIVILSPAKEAGNKTLKIGRELWSYLKATETTMKLPPSMLLMSWNGSDLTNDDLVRESDLVDDYDLKYILEEKIGDQLCWKIELTPKPEAPVVWGKIYYWIRKIDLNPALTQYYDEKGKLIRTMKFTDIKMVDGRNIPSRWTIVNNLKAGHYTEFIYEDVKFNREIPDKIFSFRELEK